MTEICSSFYNEENYILNVYLLESRGIFYIRDELYINGEKDEMISYGITDNYEKAVSIFNIISNNKVFPCHLLCIIDDNL